VAGLVTTVRLKEKIGQYLEKGTLICLVEDFNDVEAEISVPEQDANMLVPGDPVSLKPRSQPFRTLKGKVDRIAASATDKTPEKQTSAPSTVMVYCRLDNPD